MTRLRYIDIAKGFAIICVVCGHVLIYDFYGFTEAWRESPLVQFIYSFHMPLFFFLSGLVASPPGSVRDIPKDIWKRFRTLLMPMLIVGGIYSLTIEQDLSFLADGMKYGYWYFLVLFYCYILNYFSINKLQVNSGGGKFVIQICILIALWKVSPYLVRYMPESGQQLFSINQLIAYFPYFLMGSIVKRMKLSEMLFCNSYILYASAIIWSCSSLMHFPYSNFVTTTAAILAIMNICRIIEQQCLPGNKLLEYIGLNTLYIYSFHYFALQLMEMSFMEKWLASITPSLFVDIIISIIPLAFAIILSLLIMRIIETNEAAMKIIFNK